MTPVEFWIAMTTNRDQWISYQRAAEAGAETILQLARLHGVFIPIMLKELFLRIGFKTFESGFHAASFSGSQGTLRLSSYFLTLTKQDGDAAS